MAKPPAKSCASTQQSVSASGNIQAYNRSATTTTRGRSTRTALKALKPITPVSSPPPTLSQDQVEVVIPEINVINSEETISQANENESINAVQEINSIVRQSVLDIPSICQLRDYPNLSNPLLISARVPLPYSPPVSPLFGNDEGDILESTPVTPDGSPKQESVIKPNPAYIYSVSVEKSSSAVLEAANSEPVFASTPVGEWDNCLQLPTFLYSDSEFWRSRSHCRHKIPIVSTDTSDDDIFADKSLYCPLLEDPVTQHNIALTQSSIEPLESVSDMAGSKESEEAHIKALDMKVRDLCDDLDPNLISEHSAPSMNRELDKISDAKDSYRQAVRNYLTNFSDHISLPEKAQWEADLASTLKLVKEHKFKVLEKVNILNPPAPSMTEFEKETIELQKKQLSIQEQVLKTKQNEALAIAKPLKKLLEDKCTELEEDIVQIPASDISAGDDQQVTKVMQKIGSWRKSLESVTSLYQQFQTTTALHKLPQADHDKVTADFERVKTVLTEVITIAEEEDTKRHLYSLDKTPRVEQIKWPQFSGDPGEDFFQI